MAHLQMGEVVRRSEYNTPRIGLEYTKNAKAHFAARLFTDAIFNQDIRGIQTIINRIDGGLPKDTEIDEYQTLFGDCMNEVLEMTSGLQLKVMPEDTVMMALCKSLYDMATTDIYHEIKSDKNGNKWAKKRNPSTEMKQARDTARRMVLERAGGRKTATPAPTKAVSTIEMADWITKALPQEEGTDESL